MWWKGEKRRIPGTQARKGRDSCETQVYPRPPFFHVKLVRGVAIPMRMKIAGLVIAVVIALGGMQQRQCARGRSAGHRHAQGRHYLQRHRQAEFQRRYHPPGRGRRIAHLSDDAGQGVQYADAPAATSTVPLSAKRGAPANRDQNPSRPAPPFRFAITTPSTLRLRARVRRTPPWWPPMFMMPMAASPSLKAPTPRCSSRRPPIRVV